MFEMLSMSGNPEIVEGNLVHQDSYERIARRMGAYRNLSSKKCSQGKATDQIIYAENYQKTLKLKQRVNDSKLKKSNKKSEARKFDHASKVTYNEVCNEIPPTKKQKCSTNVLNEPSTKNVENIKQENDVIEMPNLFDDLLENLSEIESVDFGFDYQQWLEKENFTFDNSAMFETKSDSTSQAEGSEINNSLLSGMFETKSDSTSQAPTYATLTNVTPVSAYPGSPLLSGFSDSTPPASVCSAPTPASVCSNTLKQMAEPYNKAIVTSNKNSSVYNYNNVTTGSNDSKKLPTAQHSGSMVLKYFPNNSDSLSQPPTTSAISNNFKSVPYVRNIQKTDVEFPSHALQQPFKKIMRPLWTQNSPNLAQSQQQFQKTMAESNANLHVALSQQFPKTLAENNVNLAMSQQNLAQSQQQFQKTMAESNANLHVALSQQQFKKGMAENNANLALSQQNFAQSQQETDDIKTEPMQIQSGPDKSYLHCRNNENKYQERPTQRRVQTKNTKRNPQIPQAKQPINPHFNQAKQLINPQPNQVKQLSNPQINQTKQLINPQPNPVNVINPQSNQVNVKYQIKSEAVVDQPNQIIINQPVQMNNQRVQINNQPVQMNNQRVQINNQPVQMNNQRVQINNQPVQMNNQTFYMNNPTFQMNNQQMQMNNQTFQIQPMQMNNLMINQHNQTMDNRPPPPDYRHVAGMSHTIPQTQSQMMYTMRPNLRPSYGLMTGGQVINPQGFLMGQGGRSTMITVQRHQHPIGYSATNIMGIPNNMVRIPVNMSGSRIPCNMTGVPNMSGIQNTVIMPQRSYNTIQGNMQVQQPIHSSNIMYNQNFADMTHRNSPSNINQMSNPATPESPYERPMSNSSGMTSPQQYLHVQPGCSTPQATNDYLCNDGEFASLLNM